MSVDEAAADRGPTPASAPDPAVETLDRSVIAEIRKSTGSPEFTAMLINQFLDEASSYVDTLREAARQSDATTLKRTAHTLKGTSLTLGAQRMAAICRRIEEQATQAPGAALASILSELLERELSNVREALAMER